MKNFTILFLLILTIACKQKAPDNQTVSEKITPQIDTTSQSLSTSIEDTVTKMIVEIKDTMTLKSITKTIAQDIMCFGNEPYWSVEISEKKKTIHFKELDGANIVFDYINPSVKGDIQIFDLKKEGNRMKITIQKGACGDGMSDSKHSFSSKVTLNDTQYSGCGRLKK
jgi:uncharacterized membrane protein